MYERLKSPLKIGKLTLPNRLAMTAMGVNLGKPEGGVTDDLIKFYEARARGGVGLIITEVTRIEGGAGISLPPGRYSRTPASGQYGPSLEYAFVHPTSASGPGSLLLGNRYSACGALRGCQPHGR